MMVESYTVRVLLAISLPSFGCSTTVERPVVQDQGITAAAMEVPAIPTEVPPGQPPARSTEAADEVQERGIIKDFGAYQFKKVPFQNVPMATPFPSPPEASSVPQVMQPGIVGPLTGENKLPDRYQAPTPNLTAVANALALQHNSLVTALILPPSLRLTVPVDITVEYLSPASPRETITHTYAAETGMRLVQHDGLGDGKPRRVIINITLAERPIAGNGAHFVMNWQVDLDPLFNVEISSLRFKLLDDCDWVGKSEVAVAWDFPTRTTGRTSFSARAGRLITIPNFAWSGTGISARDMLLRPVVRFGEHDPTCLTPLCFVSDTGTGESFFPLTPLIPGQTGVVTETLKAMMESCRAEFSYPIVYVPYQDPAVSQPQSTIVLDNRSSSVERIGTWTAFAGAGFYGFDSEFSGTATPLKRFRWIPTIPATGLYNVYVWWPNNTNRSTSVPYTVHHADGETVTMVNQKAGGNQWVLHGRYRLQRGMTTFVEVSNANGIAGADAVKFEFAGAANPNQRQHDRRRAPSGFVPFNK